MNDAPAPTDDQLFGLPRREDLNLSIYVERGEGDPQIIADDAIDRIYKALHEAGEDQLIEAMKK